MKLTTQISIIIGCIILGVSYLGVQFMKQISIEKQQQIQIKWERDKLWLER
jgi:cell division protein FtsX